MTAPAIYAGDLREVLRNPGAMIGGVIGTILVVILGVVLSFIMGLDCEKQFREEWIALEREPYSDDFNAEAAEACAEAPNFGACEEKLREKWLEEDRAPYALDYGIALQTACPRPADEEEFEIPFEPGALVKLGEEIPEEVEKVIVQETRVEEETVEETVTEEQEVEEPEPEEKKKEPVKKKKKPKKKPTKKDNKLPTADKETEANTPFKDKPTVDVNRGDPFGDAGGWSDLRKDGDPWATNVMKALNNMPVGTFGAKATDGDFRFQLTLCKDGSIKTVARKGGSLDRAMQNNVVLALNQLDLPKPPPDVAKGMKGSCAKLKYTFRWSARGVR